MEFVKSIPGNDPIIVEGYFAVAPHAMFEAWTDPDIVMKWFGPEPNSLHSAAIDLKVGGAWRFVKSSTEEETFGFEGEYREIIAGKKLVKTWIHFVEKPGAKRKASTPSQVEVTFIAKGSGTQLRVVHSSIDDDAMRKGFTGGWERGIGNLAALYA